MEWTDQAEIRLLGPLLVRRGDGTVVRRCEWKTGKTVELLRLLALNVGEPVEVEGILDKIWPDVPVGRAKASLRTAASQIRRTLGSDCVERTGCSLVLREAWVDVQAYSVLIDEVEHARRTGDHAQTVSLVHEAEALYGGDLECSETASEWWYDAQHRWRQQRHRMLLSGVEAALAMNWMREAKYLAIEARELDPTSEQAARSLMLATAGLGEFDEALATFERLRRLLADAFGADPSPPTRALHLQLLTTSVDTASDARTVGQEVTIDALVSAVVRIRSHGSEEAPGAGIVLLRGKPGSGRGSIVTAACCLLKLTAARLTSARVDTGVRPDDTFGADIVVAQKLEDPSLQALDELRTVAHERGVVLIVPVRQRAHSPAALHDTGPSKEHDGETEVADVSPLSDSDLRALARTVLQGEPSRGLLRTLQIESAALAGRASTIARGWLRQGRVTWTPDGLTLREPDAQAGTLPHHQALGPSIARLPDPAIDVLTALAVLDEAVSHADVAALFAALHPGREVNVVEALDLLVDRGFVRLSGAGYVMRTDRHRDEVLAWMRPVARRRMHCRIAQTMPLDSVRTVRHWLAGGEPDQAREVGVAALRAASEADDSELARRLLDTLRHLPRRLQPDGIDVLPSSLGHMTVAPAEPAPQAKVELLQSH